MSNDTKETAKELIRKFLKMIGDMKQDIIEAVEGRPPNPMKALEIYDDLRRMRDSYKDAEPAHAWHKTATGEMVDRGIIDPMIDVSIRKRNALNELLPDVEHFLKKHKIL